MLLKPRATTLVDCTPVCATSTPGSPRRWSATVVVGRVSISRSLTTSTRAGASSAFSVRLEADTTSGFSSTLPPDTVAFTVAVRPAATTASSRRSAISPPLRITSE